MPADKSPSPLCVTAHHNICEELNAIYEHKNALYGESFHRTFSEEGWAMPRIRLSDKLSRFKVLSHNVTSANCPAVRDTLLDLANYAIMTVMELDEAFGDGRAQEPARKAPVSLRGDGTLHTSESALKS